MPKPKKCISPQKFVKKRENFSCILFVVGRGIFHLLFPPEEKLCGRENGPACFYREFFFTPDRRGFNLYRQIKKRQPFYVPLLPKFAG
jgi:hypothetical protein